MGAQGHTFTHEEAVRGGKGAAVTKLAASAIVKEMKELAGLRERGADVIRQEMEKPNASGEPRIRVIARAMISRAEKGDVKAATLVLAYTCGKPAMADSDREAGRPILQMNNNQIIAQQAPASSEPSALRPTITLPASLPTFTETSAETNKTSENV